MSLFFYLSMLNYVVSSNMMNYKGNPAMTVFIEYRGDTIVSVYDTNNSKVSLEYISNLQRKGITIDFYKYWNNYSIARKKAMEVSAFTNKLYIAVDNSPHFSIIKSPIVGEKVSVKHNNTVKSIGKISKISLSLRKITVDSGDIFHRRNMSGIWQNNSGILVRS